MKTKSFQNKQWRLNITVIYYGQSPANCYRFNILELLKNLATIYKLDYAISVEHQFSYEIDLTEEPIDRYIADLVYFRSNENSLVDAKELRSIIGCMFNTKQSLFYGTVDICNQLYKALPQYPFPNEFYRPLDYPYIEFHEGSQKTLYVYKDEVMKIVEKGINSYSN